jgi:hypothetical protein
MVGEKGGSCTKAEMVKQIVVGSAFQLYGKVIATTYFRIPDSDGKPGDAIFAPLCYRQTGSKLLVHSTVFFFFNLQQMA